MDPAVDAFGAAGAEYRFTGKRRAAEGTFLFHKETAFCIVIGGSVPPFVLLDSRSVYSSSSKRSTFFVASGWGDLGAAGDDASPAPSASRVDGCSPVSMILIRIPKA